MQVERDLGPIDVWINCAMVTVFGEFMDIADHEFRRVTEVTYLGYVNGTRAALRHMRPRDRGVIVQVGSALAFRSIPMQSAYCGAKHAIVGFSESVRTELLAAGSQVRVTAVHLPAMNTPQFTWNRSKMPRQAQPVPPIYQPELAAAAIWFAATHRRRELLLGWPTVLAVEGEKLAPALADRWLAHTGIDGQMIDEPHDPDAPDNLFAPVDDDRDFGAHGDFDGRARAHSPQLWLSTHRLLLGAAALFVAGALLGTRRR
jgi:NAD(P)-dependent dehydrogenase (short-subunit alcohol dehydrogenase family)